MFSRARLSAERMIAKLVRFANIEVSGALAEFALMRAASWASLAGPVRLPVPVKFSIANRALRQALVNDSLRLGFSGLFSLRLGDGQANDRDQDDSHLDVIHRCNTPTMNIASAFPSL